MRLVVPVRLLASGCCQHPVKCHSGSDGIFSRSYVQQVKVQKCVWFKKRALT